jgi:hypothetical protein
MRGGVRRTGDQPSVAMTGRAPGSVGMRPPSGIACPFLLTVLLFAGCASDGGGGGSKQGPLPPNPQDWVCQDSVVELSQAEIDAWCTLNQDQGEPAPPELRNPPALSELVLKNEFDERLVGFLRNRVYATDLDWNRDMNWRMTGPYVGQIGLGEFFGVHSTAVRIYYSPEVVGWLCDGRRGAIPDGAMIIKEQHPIDDKLDIAVDGEGCMDIRASVEPTNWTVFIKREAASEDGWYQGSIRSAPTGADPPRWQVGNPPVFDRSAITSPDFFSGTQPPLERDHDWYPTGYLFLDPDKHPDTVWTYNQYGNWCINCHASATSESTFSTLVNLITPGTQFKQFSPDLVFLRNPDFTGDLHIPQRVALLFLESQNEMGFSSPFTEPLAQPTDEFLEFYDQIPPVSFARAWELRLPAETYDHQVSFTGGPATFLTSDQCIGCHDATFFNFNLPNMIAEETQSEDSTKRYNLSPYAEWKASPLGQAGRDPIFFAQVESETNFFAATGLPPLSDPTLCIQNTCLHCHGVMGQRQYQIDTEGQSDEDCNALFGIAPPQGVPVGRPLSARAVTQWPDAADAALQRYGGLARDGISCTVCHHITDEGFGGDAIYTGNFVTGPADEIYGPYENVVVKPMQNSLGITPRLGSQVRDADLCGSCHNILLPIVSNQGALLDFSYEQTTHLEWQNSDYAPGRPLARSCQGCHMPETFHGKPLKFKIANIESNALPPVQNRLPDDEIMVRTRDRYARHSLHGLNVFLNEMFQEFPLILGIRQVDFMSGVATELPLSTARDSFLQMARHETATVAIESVEFTAAGQLKAVVKVTNHTGHYLPSGVSFRRVFLELVASDANGTPLWASGRTNGIGAIIAGVDGPVLPSERLLENPQAFQPHYQLIDREDQVQIYQELVADSDNDLTSSFLRRVSDIKNNRIRPKGFDPAFFASNPSRYVRELAKIPGAAQFDPDYTDPSRTGADEMEYLVTLDPDALARVDRVTVTLYNQSIPPFYLQQRFADANIGAGIKDNIERLYYLTSHLNTTDAGAADGDAFIEDWKLMLATDTVAVDMAR